MSDVARLLTRVDLDDHGGDPRRMSVSVQQEAVLSDGARIRVIEDRGWSAGLHGSIPEAADIRSLTSVEDIEQMARVVVGPDEPVDALKSRSGL
jgi:hypothetical protein